MEMEKGCFRMSEFSFTELEKQIGFCFIWFLSSLVLFGVIGAATRFYFGISWADSINRSGSIMVLMGVMTEYRVFKTKALFELRPIMDAEAEERCRLYKSEIDIAHVAALTIICVGTVVWGYGDLMFAR